VPEYDDDTANTAAELSAVATDDQSAAVPADADESVEAASTEDSAEPAVA
jgi:hypothetical protein